MYVFVCASRQTRECDATLYCSKETLGASDQPLHQFTGTVEGLSFSLSLLPTFSLCHVSPILPLPSPHRSLPVFLLQREPLLTLMKRHVLCDSLSRTNMTDGARDDGSRVGQERRGTRENGKRDNAPLTGR